MSLNEFGKPQNTVFFNPQTMCFLLPLTYYWGDNFNSPSLTGRNWLFSLRQWGIYFLGEIYPIFFACGALEGADSPVNAPKSEKIALAAGLISSESFFSSVFRIKTKLKTICLPPTSKNLSCSEIFFFSAQFFVQKLSTKIGNPCFWWSGDDKN